MNLAIEAMRQDGPTAAVERAQGVSDPVEWSRGDIIRVWEAPAGWDTDPPQMNAPRKCLIIITDFPFTVERAKHFLEQKLGGDFDADPLLHQRNVTIDPSLLPVAVRQKLTNPPYNFVVSWSQVKASYIRRKSDNHLVTDSDF